MKLSISNIAWNNPEDKQIAKLLNDNNIRGVEIAPGIIWDHPEKVTKLEAQSYLSFWKKYNIKLVAMQGLLYGHNECHLFKDVESRIAMHTYLEKIITLASYLGIESLVFGSPKNRVIPDDMPKDNALDIAYDFFNSIGYIAQRKNITIGIEANPAQYGTNFINTTKEAVDFVNNLDNPNIRVQMDIGTMTVNMVNYEKTIGKTVPFANHAHISESNLKHIPQKSTDHNRIARALKKSGYDEWVSIEMRESGLKSNLDQVKSSIDFVKKMYNL